MYPPASSLLLWAPLLLSAVVAQTPPGFSPSAENHLNIVFDTTKIQPPGVQINVNVPLNPPTISLAHLPTPPIPTFLFALVDPDAPFPNDPVSAQFLHMLLPNIPTLTRASQRKGDFILDITSPVPFVPYVNPTPPNDSPPHRYVALLFAQPEGFAIPEAFDGFSAENRSSFNVGAFASAAGLGAPVAANWFLVGNQTEPEMPLRRS